VRVLRTLNLDPGFHWLGWSVTEMRRDHDVVVAMGLIRTEPSKKKLNVRSSDDNFRRAREIAHELVELSMHEVSAVCFEAMSHVRSSSSMAKIGMCYGAIAMLVEMLDCPALAVTPQEVRKKLKVKSKEDVAKRMFEKYRHHDSSRLAIQAFLHQYARNEANHVHAWDSLGVLEAVRDSELIRALRR
jgi:Holliday junction resolvasome RuvABC endonuclease subunit